MSSKIPTWHLSPSDLSMHELGTRDQIAQKLLKKRQEVAGVFDHLLGQSGHNTQEAADVSRLSPNQKQMLMLALGQAADFEAFSDDTVIKVGISQAINGITPVGSYVYISQNDSVAKFKEVIRESWMFSGGEAPLHSGLNMYYQIAWLKADATSSFFHAVFSQPDVAPWCGLQLEPSCAHWVPPQTRCSAKPAQCAHAQTQEACTARTKNPDIHFLTCTLLFVFLALPCRHCTAVHHTIQPPGFPGGARVCAVAQVLLVVLAGGGAVVVLPAR